MFICTKFRHYDYQCLSKNLHTDFVYSSEIDNLNIIGNTHIPSEITIDLVDKLMESSTPHMTLDVHFLCLG